MKKIAFTTSRNPANKTRSFIKDIISVIPYASKFNRGSSRLAYTLNLLKQQDYHSVIVVHSVKGNPNFWRIFDLSENEPQELPYAIKVRGLTLSREYTNIKTKQPNHSILLSSIDDNDKENIIKLILNISEDNLSQLESSNYVTAYIDYLDEEDELMYIEFTDKNNVSIGPRLKIKIIPRKVDSGD